jgi:adenosylcobyric acid synthase
MLGRVICDPHGLESMLPEVPGLGLLPVETTFEQSKATYQAEALVCGGPGWLGALTAREVQGYEIHLGRTSGASPWLEICQRNGRAVRVMDGAVSDDGRVWGCYLHGLFTNAALRRTWLDSLRGAATGPAPSAETSGFLHDSLERLADAVETALDMKRLESILQEQSQG